MYSAEIVGALANNLSPSFSMASKWENEVKKEFETYLRVNGWPPSSLGSRFFSSPWSKDIPPPLLDTLRSFQHLIAYYESASDIENEDSRIKNNYLIFATRRLFHLPMECPLSPSHETIRLAILAYCSSRIWSTPLSPCVDTIMKALRPALAQSFNKLQNTAPDLLFWILFIFGFSTQNMQYQPWIATHIRQSAKSLKLESWNDALPVLEVFFFVCRSPQDPAISYWTSAISSEPFGVQKQVQNRT
ncbi:hypothetical protein N7468_008908 [Penicillium chermesinum]|uniref:Uncharacterized protein n=1 Tax=Penicillium chermesinum TaxID=63820 RepID=A0A9W9NGU0_9EURO|nr:uncharacterized protein N7468_008908 [Penicillium chermesinum]KAJ5219704.1 hypothetical protein N7468_008908 [Penicillium chermesinum]